MLGRAAGKGRLPAPVRNDGDEQLALEIQRVNIFFLQVPPSYSYFSSIIK